MSKTMLIDAKHQDETRVVVVDKDVIEDFDFVTSSKAQLKGNIYLAKITRVEPSLQAAFVEYGGNKQGFLPFSEIHPDYYQIPVEDRQKLIEEELEEVQRAEEAEEAELENKQSRGRGGKRRRGNRHKQSGERGDKFAQDAAEEEVESDVEQAGSAEDSAEDDEAGASYQAAAIAQPETSGEPEEEAEQPQASSGADDANDADAEEDDDSEEAETISADEAEERPRRRGSSFKRYRIQEVIKRHQIVLVQVIKEERGNKGCSLTTYISLAGRYCVLMPNSPKGGGVSRKISNGEQRRKLKEILAELREKRGFSAIIRTAGLDRTKTEIRRDYEYLVKMWSQIREDTLASNAPSLIYEESDIIKRSIRDMYTGDIEQVLVQGEDAYRDSKGFMKMIMPSHAPRVKLYKEEAPIFAVHGVEEQLASMYEPSVKLPSGGYVVIQQTEALISIDVNSGRSTTERNVEETAIKTNLEAAREVARQMRLRDIAGLIVIDFIDMYYGKNRRTLERAMKDYLKTDRAKIQVSRISPFGLMELSRQRLRPSIAESSTTLCPHCQGSGFVKSVETVAIQVIRLLEREAVCGDYTALNISTTAEIAIHLLNDKRPQIQEIEEENDLDIGIQIDTALTAGQFRLMKTGSDGKEMLHQELEEERGRRKKSRGRRGGRNRKRRDDAPSASDANEAAEEKPSRGDRGQSAAKKSADIKETQDSQEESKPRRSRKRSPVRKQSEHEERTATDVQESNESVNERDDANEAKPEEDGKSTKPRRRASTRRGGGSKPRSAKGKSSNDNVSEAKDTAAKADATPDSQGDSESPRPDSPAHGQAASQDGASPGAEPSQAGSASAGGSSADTLDPSAPKRKGWWNRVLQGAEDNA